MSELYGNDFITITDDDGKEYELEVLSTIETDDAVYLALVPAGVEDDPEAELEVSILKKVMEDGEEILVTVDDEDELEEVYGILMDSLYEDEDEAE